MTTEPTLIECPFCAEPIKAKAKKCKHCGEFLGKDLTDDIILEEFEKEKEAIGQTQEAQTQPSVRSTPAAQPAAAQPAIQPTEPPPQAAAPTQTTEQAVAGAQVVVQTTMATPQEETMPTEDPLADLYEKLVQMPASPERDQVLQTLEQLALETQKGEGAEKAKIETFVETVVEVLPDVAEVTINTMINPTSGLITLVQKIAKHATKSKEKQDEEEQPVLVEETSEVVGQADTEKAIDALEQVQEQLKQLPQSEEIELVQETIEQLETKSDEVEEKEQEEEDTRGEEVVEGVSKAMPGVIQTVAKVAEKIVEQIVENKSQETPS